MTGCCTTRRPLVGTDEWRHLLRACRVRLEALWMGHRVGRLRRWVQGGRETRHIEVLLQAPMVPHLSTKCSLRALPHLGAMKGLLRALTCLQAVTRLRNMSRLSVWGMASLRIMSHLKTLPHLRAESCLQVRSHRPCLKARSRLRTLHSSLRTLRAESSIYLWTMTHWMAMPYLWAKA